MWFRDGSHGYFYRLQTKLRKGNVFTPVCQSFCSQGGCLPQCMLGYTPLGRHPPNPVHAGIHTPLPSACWDTHTPLCQVHAGIDMATSADGMHPTGMQSCWNLKFNFTYKFFFVTMSKISSRPSAVFFHKDAIYFHKDTI